MEILNLVNILKATSDRTLLVARRLEASIGSHADDVNATALEEFLSLQHDDGSWGSDDYPILKAVFTAQAVMGLGLLGLSTPAQSPFNEGNQAFRARQWLLAAQRPDGSWGEDAFDTCEALKALHILKVPAEHESVRNGLAFVRRLVDAEWCDIESFWSGTGFVGAALEVFNLYEDTAYSRVSLRQLSSCFDDQKGLFGRGSGRDSSMMGAPIEWHNACALLGLRSFGSAVPNPTEFHSALKWLKASQSSGGPWSPGHDEITAICTYQVIAALTQIEGPRDPSARRGADWLVRRSTGNPPIAGYNERFMAGAAVARTRAQEMRIELSVILLGELRGALLSAGDDLASASVELRSMAAEVQRADERMRGLDDALHKARHSESSLATEVATLREGLEVMRQAEVNAREELGRYALKLTSNQLAVWGLVLTVMTFFAGLFLSGVLAD